MDTQAMPSPADISLAQLNLTRAIQRYASSKAACLEMFGSLSILVVPQSSFKVLAAASWDVYAARNRLGDLQARRLAWDRSGWSKIKINNP